MVRCAGVTRHGGNCDLNVTAPRPGSGSEAVPGPVPLCVSRRALLRAVVQLSVVRPRRFEAAPPRAFTVRRLARSSWIRSLRIAVALLPALLPWAHAHAAQAADTYE